MTATPLNVGFLTIVQEGAAYLGGYLVTNGWGRPLEFRLSSAVQPNKVQQILYGPTLVPYLCADLIGKTLVDRAGIAVNLVVTDREPALDLRLKLDSPVVWLARSEEAGGRESIPLPGDRGVLVCHPRFAADNKTVGELLAELNQTIDLTEPFTRIRDAMTEARKLGVNRSAA